MSKIRCYTEFTVIRSKHEERARLEYVKMVTGYEVAGTFNRPDVQTNHDFNFKNSNHRRYYSDLEKGVANRQQ